MNDQIEIITIIETPNHSRYDVIDSNENVGHIVLLTDGKTYNFCPRLNFIRLAVMKEIVDFVDKKLTESI